MGLSLTQKMPQDSLRSAVYRSFVTCDDPKGVVECGTIRKSKSNPKKLEDEVKIRRTTTKNYSDFSVSTTSMEEGKEMMDSRNITTKDSHNQLMEVSREALKLTNVIDTWSTGKAFDGHSKDIAKDLLKGALDLQESLVMLGKLQEASQYIGKLKKKQKEKSKRDFFDEQGFQRTNSDRFGDRGYDPRVSVDGASRDCFDELRTVIRDSLARQNLLPPGSDDEKAFYRDKRTLDSITDVASSSSSQSSMVQYRNFASSNGSVSSMSPLKSKGSNLIAKLMGLEELPSKVVSNAPPKELECDGWPVFEVDKPMKMKPQSAAASKVDAEKMKLNKIVENMKSKGVLNSNFGEGFQFQYHRSTASNYRKTGYSMYDPPIVVIKPRHFSSSKAEEPHPQMFTRDLKLVKHHPQAMYQRDGAPNSISRRLQAGLSSQTGGRIHNVVQEKPENVMAKTNGKTSSVKKKSSLPVDQQQKRKTTDEKKAVLIQKVKPMRKKQAEMEDVPKPRDEANLNCAEERKMKAGAKISKNRTSIRKIPSSETRTPVTQKAGDRKKKLNSEKTAKEGLPDNVFIGDSSRNSSGTFCNVIDRSGKNASDMGRTSAGATDELLTEEGTVDYDVHVQALDQMNSCKTSMHNAPPQTHEGTCINESDDTQTRTRTEEEDFLWGNLSFISHADTLFDISSSNRAMVWQTGMVTDIKKADSRLFLDCANELVLHKRHRCEQVTHPLSLSSLTSTRMSISLGNLVEEVCDEIMKLKSYSENAGEKLRMDGLYAALERDLGSFVGPSRAWDLGWRHGFTMDEVEQVVGGIEELVFSELIQEIFADNFL